MGRNSDDSVDVAVLALDFLYCYYYMYVQTDCTFVLLCRPFVVSLAFTTSRAPQR